MVSIVVEGVRLGVGSIVTLPSFLVKPQPVVRLELIVVDELSLHIILTIVLQHLFD
jgi:hypothetical protein